MNVRILVCCHNKNCPQVKSPYVNIHVGKTLHPDMELNIQGDNTGDNISYKNNNYCELTGLYWAWKNLKNVDVLGICHYRRYFDLSSIKDVYREPFFNSVTIPAIKESTINGILEKFDVVLPCNVYLYDSIWDDYAIRHSRSDMVEVEKAILKFYPDCIKSFDYIMHKCNCYSSYNMMICKKEIFDDYCEWLFTIFNEVEKHMDISKYDSYQSRVFGFMSERLLNVYVHYKGLSVCHRPIISLISGKNHMRLYQLLHRIKANICFKLKS